MSGDHRITTTHNKNLLLNSNFRQVGNTQIYQKGDACILSPAISQNSQGKYWFDIREVILNRIVEVGCKNFSMIFVRIIPNIFVVINFTQLKPLMKKHAEKNGYKVWSFEIGDNFRNLYNKKDKDKQISIKRVPENEFISLLNQI